MRDWIGDGLPALVRREGNSGGVWEELKSIRQAVTFLVIHQKPKKSLDLLFSRPSMTRMM